MSSWSGNLIRLARLQAGLSQRALAERAHTSQATIATYETGKKSPSLETLVRIVGAAGQDLRIRLAPQDAHDEWLRRYLEELPPAVVKRLRAQDREVAEAVRSAS